MKSMLFGVPALDVTAFLTVGAILLAAALLACYLPARRAASLHPMSVLRMESSTASFQNPGVSRDLWIVFSIGASRSRHPGILSGIGSERRRKQMPGKSRCFPVRRMAVVASALAAGVAAGCGSNGIPGGGGGGTGPIAGESTTVTVVASSAANDQLVRFGLDLQSLTLTDKDGKTASLFSTGPLVEFMHLNGSAEPLLTVSVPQDTYTSATATVGSASFVCTTQQSGGLDVSTYAYGATPGNQVTVQLPQPLIVDGTSMAVSLELLVSQSAAFPSNCYDQSGLNQYTITPTFDLAAMNISPQPTSPANGRLTALEGLVASAGSSPGSLTVTSADSSVTGGQSSSTTWQVSADGNTIFQGIGNASGLAAGMPVDIDGALQSDGSILATRIAVPDADPTNLTVNSGPLIQVAASVPLLDQVNQQEEGPVQNYIIGWPSYNFSSSEYSIWGGLTNVASLPFAAGFSSANMVDGQMVLITTHATSVQPYPLVVPATTITLMPQTIDGTVEATAASGGFTTYTVQLAAYDIFPMFAVQSGQTTLLTNPQQVVVYVDSNTQIASGASPAVGAVSRFSGVIFNDNGTLRMDCTAVNSGVTE